MPEAGRATGRLEEPGPDKHSVAGLLLCTTAHGIGGAAKEELWRSNFLHVRCAWER
jgi:hypothetical protein